MEKKLFDRKKIGDQKPGQPRTLLYVPSVSPSNTGSYTEKVFFIVYGFCYERNRIGEMQSKNRRFFNYGQTMGATVINWAAKPKIACPAGWHYQVGIAELDHFNCIT